jgi:polyketide synthase PksN
MGERLALQVSSLAELEEKLGKYLQEPQEQGDWYRGQVKRHKEVVALVSQDEDLQEAIGKWFQWGKYEKLLEWWAKGLKIDWSHLYRENRPRRISLPTYPFARERYWILIEASPMATTSSKLSTRQLPVEQERRVVLLTPHWQEGPALR